MSLLKRALKAAASLIEKHGLLHPRELAERCEMLVLEIPYRYVGGLSLDFAGARVVAVDPLLPASQQNGILLHEIGHQVLHPGVAGFFIESNPLERPAKYELEAHLFALVYLLLWDRRKLEECGNDVFRFAGYYGLPRRAAEVVYEELSWQEKKLNQLF